MRLLDHVRHSAPADGYAPLASTHVDGDDARSTDNAVRPMANSTSDNPIESPEPTRSSRTSPRPDLHAQLKTRVHEELIRDLDPTQLSADIEMTSRVRRAVERAAEERLGTADEALPRYERQRLASEVADEVLGLGPIEPLLRDPMITEIMVNGHDRVYYETDGVIRRAQMSFRDDAHVLNIIDKILRPVSRRLDDSSPMVDARLPDGSRVNAIVPPLAVRGPSLTIRKFSRELLTVEDLVRLGTLSRPVVDFLAACVRARANIVVSGGTGTGKTTLLNLLSAFIPEHERIVTIEDPAELQIHQDDWVSLETRPPNIEGKGQVTQRELVKNALRMRPDRILVGECRAGEAFDMLQAMNTGHDGSITTVHANGPRDALTRIENMVLMAVDLPVPAIREQIASGIHLVVHLARLQNGSRRVTAISEITGMQTSVVSIQDVFKIPGQGVDSRGQVGGELQPTGMRPHLLERLKQAGQSVPLDIFLPSAQGGSGTGGD
ncbi:MAG: CpaF family protein [Chloroflexi bacterium]|nr:CpaF family protein [Chloroflexota bacterium]